MCWSLGSEHFKSFSSSTSSPTSLQLSAPESAVTPTSSSPQDSPVKANSFIHGQGGVLSFLFILPIVFLKENSMVLFSTQPQVPLFLFRAMVGPHCSHFHLGSYHTHLFVSHLPLLSLVKQSEETHFRKYWSMQGFYIEFLQHLLIVPSINPKLLAFK